MRWWWALAALGLACAPEEIDVLATPDEDAAEPLGDPALAALQRGDPDTFVLELNDELTAMQEWASAFERDIDAATPLAGPELRAAFRRWKAEHSEVRAELKRLAQSGLVQRAGSAIHGRVAQLEAEARRIDDLRSPRLEAAAPK